MNKKIETPLQRLIAELKEVESGFEEAGHRDMAAAVYISRSKAELLLPYEREVIENFGTEMQTIDYVCGNGIYHDVRFTFEPKELFNQTFQTNE